MHFSAFRRRKSLQTVAFLTFLVANTVEATVLTFEPFEALTNAPPGQLPAAYGDRVAAFDQDGFRYGPAGGLTPDVRLSSGTGRLLRDQPGNTASYGLMVVPRGWSHGKDETALLARVPDLIDDQEIRLTLRGSDRAWPVLHGFDVVARDGAPASVPVIAVTDGVLTTLYATNNAVAAASAPLQIRFDPPLSSERLLIVIGYGRKATPAGLDNVTYGQRPVPPQVWQVQSAFGFLTTNPNCSSQQLSPASFALDRQRRLLLAWSEFNGCGGSGLGFWARRDAGTWQTTPLSAVEPSAAFSGFDPAGGLALTASSNGVPFVFYPAANFASDSPYYLDRLNLDTTPHGPGTPVHGFGGGRGPDLAFAADGRASFPPTFVTHMPGFPLRLNGATALTGSAIETGLTGDLLFSQGPQGQIHVVYERDDQLRYNGGGSDRDQAILRINTGSQHPHDLAVGSDNSIHLSAAQGTGRYFFGAVGQLVYLHSIDGTSWSTNVLIPQTDVGATAIALDAGGRPAVAFTRAFDSVYFTRQTASGWTPPTLIRTGLGGWDRSRVVRLAFDGEDVPHIAVYDGSLARLLVLSPTSAEPATDLAVEIKAGTNRLAVGASTSVTVTAVNASTRNAGYARLRLKLPPEVVVRDFQPRPDAYQGSEYVYELGTLQALERRPLSLTLAALDAVNVCLEAEITSDAAESNPDDNRRRACVTAIVPSNCLTSNPGAECQTAALLPNSLPPALSGQPWSQFLRVPSAPADAVLRVVGPVPTGFCFTSDGQLRGYAGAAGDLSVRFELATPDGKVLPFERSLHISRAGLPGDLLAFWPLDEDTRDVVSGEVAEGSHRTAYVAGAVGGAAQTTRNVLEDPRLWLKQPPAILTSPMLRGGAAFGTNAVTLSGWFRRDGGTSRGGGVVLGLAAPETLSRERYLLLEPATGRVLLASGPPDFRATQFRGPVLPSNTWHHLAVVCEQKQARLYVDGVQAVTGVFNEALAERPRVVAGGAGDGTVFTGTLDEVALYGAALDAERLAALPRESLPRPSFVPAGGDFPLASVLRHLVLPDAAEGEAYRAALAAAFCGSPTAFAVVAGALPPGLKLGDDGQVTGVPSALGDYRARLQAHDAAGTSAELEVTLSVRPMPPAFAKEPEDQQVELGGLLLLAAETTRPASLQWHFNGNPLPGENRSLLSITDFSQSQAGVYQVRAENAGGVHWSRAAVVGIRATPPALDHPGATGVERLADGKVRLRMPTLRGRIYELQRALDLTQALAGSWVTVQRFQAAGDTVRLADAIAGRPDAAFYRLVEQTPMPAAAFSVLDASRFVGLAADGRPRTGLLPAQDPQTGRLAPFDFRTGGAEAPIGDGLVIRFSEGAQPILRDGATVLQFRKGELSLGEESPVQLDEGGKSSVPFSATTDLELLPGPIPVATLERWLGKPAGSGIGLVFFKHFRFRLVEGSFEGNRIRGAQLAWADRSFGFPTPERSGSYVDFDIDLSATRLRLPFYGEFSLQDGTASAAQLTVTKAAPIVVEMRPGPEFSLLGAATVRFVDGPEFTVDLRFDEPVFKGSITAKKMRLPEGLSLRQLLGTLPALPPQATPSVADFSGAAHPTLQSPFDTLDQDTLQVARAHCAGSAWALTLLRGSVEEKRLFEQPGLEAADDALERSDLSDIALATVRAWRCVTEAADGIEKLSPIAGGLMRAAFRRAVDADPQNLSPIVVRGAEIGPLTYAYRAGVLAEIALAAQAGRQTEPNPLLQPYVDRAYEALAAARDADAAEWDSTSLLVAARNLARARAVAIRNESILDATRERDLRDTFERLVRLRGGAFQREFAVHTGEFQPENNPPVASLHRWEAMARLRQAVRINAAAEIGGATATGSLPVNSEALSQLAHQVWKQLRAIVQQATNGCTAVGYHTLLAVAPEIAQVAIIADQLVLQNVRIALPTSEDALRFTVDMEARCFGGDALPPIESVLLATPQNLLARCEAHLVVLRSVPTSLREASPEVESALTALRLSLDDILVKRALLLPRFAPSELIRLLQIGLRHDQLRRRFRKDAEPDWLGKHLPTLRRALVEVARGNRDPRFLAQMNELLIQAAQRSADDPPPPSPLHSTRGRLADETDADRTARTAYYLAAHAGVSALHDLVAELGAELESPVTDALEHLADIRLPGGLTVERAFGELAYHTRLKQVSGAFGGDLQIPGAGLRLTLKQVEFHSGGALAGELFGSLSLPPNQPLATLSIPADRPARLRLDRGQPPQLSGGGRLRLSTGATIDCFLSLEDPVYRFSASASSLRLSVATNLVRQVGLAVADAATSSTGLALDYLTRVGSLLDPLQPEPEPPSDLAPLVKTQPRAQASDSDAAAATGAGLRLLVDNGLGSPNPGLANRHDADAVLAANTPLPPLSLAKAVTLMREFQPALDRSIAMLASDADHLTGLDQALLSNATPVDPAELAALRGARLTEVARRLGTFGADFQNVLVALGTERGRQILGAANLPDAATLFRPFFENYHRCLVALRTQLLVEDPQPNRDPWRRGPDWDPDAATATIEAVLRFEQLLQLSGDPRAEWSGPALSIGCSLLQNLTESRLAAFGLDPATGNLPTSGGDLALYLALSRAEAHDGLQRLLQLWTWSQGSGLCAATDQPRLVRGVAGLALRLRDTIVTDLHDILRVTPRRPWEQPEQILALATNLGPVVTLPAALGITRYPEVTDRLKPQPGLPPTDDPQVDAADVFDLLGTAAGRLAALVSDESSGYPAELRRRRRAAMLPPSGLLSAFAQRYANLPGLGVFRQHLQTLAREETRLLTGELTTPSFVADVTRDTGDLARRILNLARLLDDGATVSAPAGSRAALAARTQANASALGQITTEILPRLEALLRADPSRPWWAGADAARQVVEANVQPWTTAGVADSLRARQLALQDIVRERLGVLSTSVLPRLPVDLQLPGEVEVRRIFGGLVLNRATHFVQFEVGGRLEFPRARTANGQPAFVDLQRLRLESNGRFALEAAARTPLPFLEATFTGGFRASGDVPHRALALGGDGTLVFATAPRDPTTGQALPTSVSAAVAYEPIGYDAAGNPEGWRFAFRAGGAFQQSFGPHFAVFGAGAGLVVGQTAAGNPLGGISVGGSVGLFRKADRLGVDPPLPTDFHVVVENAQVEIQGDTGQGGSAAVTSGIAKLPDFFYAADLPVDLQCDPASAPQRTGASVAIRTPLRIRYEIGGKPRLEGSLRFSHFGARLPRAEFLSFSICQADLGLDDQGWPFLDIQRAGLILDIPWDRGAIRLQNLHLGLDGRVRGELLLAEDFDFVKTGDFRASLLGAPALTDPGNRPPDGCRGTALVFEDVAGTPTPRVTLYGGVKVTLPSSLITLTNGASVAGFFCGGIRLEPTPSGPTASAFINELGFEGDFGLGRRAFALKRAKITAGNFEGILRPDAARPFHLSVSGELQTGPFLFGLTNAQLQYLGLDRPPGLSIEAVHFARDATQTLPPPFAFLPFAVDFAEFRFKSPLAPIETVFQPTNVLVTVSGRMGLPTVQYAFVRGGAAGLQFSFREDGTPIPPPIDGFDLEVSGTADLKLPLVGDVGGRIRVGGLRRAVTDGPGHIYAVGQLSATSNGVRLGFLSAFTLLGPIGMCLDVNLGSAGIVLAPTPIQITGAAGGFAFLTTDNPCDFTQYFVFDPQTGTYQLRQTLELPSIPTGMSWDQFTQVLQGMTERATAYASNFDPGTLQLPGAGAAVPASTSPAVSLNDAAAADFASPTVALAATPVTATGPGETIGCPSNCPPATVAILCQPHPDQDRFPNRIIFKFSSIPETVLNGARPGGLGITRQSLGELGSDTATVANRVADRLVEWLNTSLPAGGTGLTPAKLGFLADQQQQALAGVRSVIRTLADTALRASPDAYTALRDTLYAGVPCPDLSLAVAGRVSMVGLSAFGWIEGREVSSLSGSGGVVGQLYALGAPLGQARAFIAMTDANGDPNPSLCGQVTASFGPLDLGRVDAAMRCDGCVTELLRLFPTLVHALGEPFLADALDRIAPAYARFAHDPNALLSALETQPPPEQIRVMLGLFTEVQGAGPSRLPGNLGELVRAAVADTWSRIDPRLTFCGEIQPRLLGLPLTFGGRTAAFSAQGLKEGLIGAFSFSPSALVPLFPPGDEASLSFSLRVRDPYQSLLAGLDGTFGDPVRLRAFVRDQVNYALENHVVAVQYQWHPFGLELGDAAARVLLPDLLDHPAFPGRRWINPDDRRASGLPTRDEVLVQAAATGKLGNAFGWFGNAQDFATIFASGDPHGDQLRSQGLDLRRDYFPHGGLVGGARMALPRLLMVHPSEWQPYYDQALHGSDLFQQLDAALTLLDEFILKNETNGTAAFYVPAPNPPMLYTATGQPLSAPQLQRALVEHPDDFTPDALLRQIRALDLRDPQTLSRYYRDDLAFLRAEMTNLTILGTPVFGKATLKGRPTPVRALDGAPLARLAFDVAGNSAVGRLAGGSFAFGFDFYATPERSLGVWGREIATELRRQRQGGGSETVALASTAAAPAARAALTRFASEVVRQLPRFAVTNALPAVTVTDPREWAGPGINLGDVLGAGGPTGATLPKAPPLLRAELELAAFSPWYDPQAPGDGPLAEARRTGGLAVQGTLELLPSLPGRTGSGSLEASVTSIGTQPRLRGRLRGLNLPSPFPGFTVQNASADFDNQANPFLRATVNGPALGYGNLFKLESTPGQPTLAASLTLGTATLPGGTRVPRTSLELDPLRLTGSRLGGRGLLVHGPAGPASPVILTEGRWDARASFVSAASLQQDRPELVLRAPLAGSMRDVVRITGLPASPFAFSALALSEFQIRLTTPPSSPLTLELFPGLNIAGLTGKTVQLAIGPSASLDLTVNSDGTFRLVGKLDQAFNSGPSGVFGAGADVRVDETGVTLSGQVGNASGTLRLGVVNNQIVSQFSGQLVLPRLVTLGGRVILSGPDGGDFTASVGPAGTCVAGAQLTLQNFAPGAAPVTFTFPAFCLDASGGFRDLAPTAAANANANALAGSPSHAASPRGHALTRPTLSVGAFRLENLGPATLSGNLTAPAVSLAFSSQLRLGSLLAIPIGGVVGSAGLVVTNQADHVPLLGLEFSGAHLGSTNASGDLPGLAFVGRLAALPPPFQNLDFTGQIPDAGGFRLAPGTPLNAAAFFPGFALNDLLPAVEYETTAYADVVRADGPSGYWPLEDAAGKVEDERLAKFSGTALRRSGSRQGGTPPSQPGPVNGATGVALSFDGTSSWIQLPSTALAPNPDAFSVSLWFKRAPGRLGVVPVATSPQCLAGRGTQWSLNLWGTLASGTRVTWTLAGLKDTSDNPLAALGGRTRLDDANWHHLAAVFDGSAQYLYLDGQLEAWQPTRGRVTPLAAAATTLAARQVNGTPAEFFAGALDEAAVFPGALSPLDALGHWLAAGGRGAVRLDGTLAANALPGLPATHVEGFLAPDGRVALQATSTGQAEFAGLRLPAFRAQLVRTADTAALAFRSTLTLPALDAASLGAVNGVISGNGTFQLAASVLEERGAFGWDLRLTNLTASGNWVQRQATATAAGRIQLPYGIAELDVAGDLNPTVGRYSLRGRADGVLPMGSRQFLLNAAPELTPNTFKLPGHLALGTAPDAARFASDLTITRPASVSAAFSGTTPWTDLPAKVHGQLSWNGTFGYVNGAPELEFHGSFALTWPNHPNSLLELEHGLHDHYHRECWQNALGVQFCNDVLDGLSLLTEAGSFVPDVRGELTLPVVPAFRGVSSITFRIP